MLGELEIGAQSWSFTKVIVWLKNTQIPLVPHRKLRRSFKSIYNVLLCYGFGPQGVPSFVEGGGPRPMWVYTHVLTRAHTHTHAHAAAAVRPTDRPCRAESSRVVKRKIFLFRPQKFPNLRKAFGISSQHVMKYKQSQSYNLWDF